MHVAYGLVDIELPADTRFLQGPGGQNLTRSRTKNLGLVEIAGDRARFFVFFNSTFKVIFMYFKRVVRLF